MILNEFLFWFPNFWRYVLECWGLWLCDSTDKIMSKKLNTVGMWLRVTKKVIEVGKSKKYTFSFRGDFVNFFVKRYFFDSTRAELSPLRLIWYRCYNLCLKHLFISLAKGFKKFKDGCKCKIFTISTTLGKGFFCINFHVL